VTKQRLEQVSIAGQRFAYVTAETAQYVEIMPIGGGPRRRLLKSNRPQSTETPRKRSFLWRMLIW
jgi:hypothetical protein